MNVPCLKVFRQSVPLISERLLYSHVVCNFRERDHNGSFHGDLVAEGRTVVDGSVLLYLKCDMMGASKGEKGILCMF